MRINDIRRPGAMNPYQSANSQRAESTGPKRQKDKVQISSEAMEMLSLAQGSNPEREKRIAQLKEAVSTGTYQVEAGKVADRMLPFFYPASTKE